WRLAPDCARRTRHSFPTRRSSDLFHPSLKPPDDLLGDQQLNHLRHERRFICCSGVRRPYAIKKCTNLLRAEPRAQKTAFLTVASDRKSTRLNSSHVSISYAVFCLK